MTRSLPLILAAFLSGTVPAMATDASLAGETVSALDIWLDDPQTMFAAADVDIEEFRWVARPVVVFADTAADPRFREQIELLLARPETLGERDVVLIVDTDPAQRSALRKKLRPRGFMLALIGKDGTVKLRKPLPWSARELTRTIDKMPLRKQEIRDRSGQ